MPGRSRCRAITRATRSHFVLTWQNTDVQTSYLSASAGRRALSVRDGHGHDLHRPQGEHRRAGRCLPRHLFRCLRIAKVLHGSCRADLQGGASRHDASDRRRSGRSRPKQPTRNHFQLRCGSAAQAGRLIARPIHPETDAHPSVGFFICARAIRTAHASHSPLRVQRHLRGLPVEFGFLRAVCALAGHCQEEGQRRQTHA